MDNQRRIFYAVACVSPLPSNQNQKKNLIHPIVF